MNTISPLSPYERILTILNYLESSYDGFSIQDLSEILDNTPPEFIAEDIDHINSLSSTLLIIPSDEEDERVFSDEEEDGIRFHGKKETYSIPLSVWNADPDKVSLLLTPFENYVLDIISGKVRENKIPDIYIKEILKASDQETIQKRNILCDAIRRNKSVEITYMTSSKEIIRYSFQPLKLVRLIDDDLYYIVYISDHKPRYYRIDRIKNIKIINENFSVNEEDLKLLEIFDYKWGMGGDECPVPVKLKIKKEAKVPERIQAELIWRKYAKWTEYDSYYIYEDLVSSLSSFKLWVRKYGSSVLVLEPLNIARELYESARARLEIYNSDLDWIPD